MEALLASHNTGLVATCVVAGHHLMLFKPSYLRRPPPKRVTPTDRLSGFGTGLAANTDSGERVPWGHR